MSSADARKQGRNFKTIVYVVVGAPGSGKSHFNYAASTARGSVYYKSRGEWWDGYEGQESVVIDDFYVVNTNIRRLCNEMS
jgi:hypothetical protein